MYKNENQYERLEKIKKKLGEVKCNHSNIKKINKTADEKFEGMGGKIVLLRKRIAENSCKIASL